MHLSQIQKRMEDMAGACLDTTALDDEAFNMEATQDRCILRLIASCCNGDKLVRATELMKLLSLEKSMKGAIKLVTALKLPNLAERFNTILEERLVNESKGIHKSPLPSSNGRASLTADAAISKMMVTSNGKNEKPESSIAFSSPTLSAPPVFIKKENKQEHEKSDQNQTTNAKTSMEPSYAEKVKSAENVLRVGEVKMTGQVLKVQSQRLSNPFLKSSNNQETTKKDLDQLTSLRPSNPFKKTPN